MSGSPKLQVEDIKASLAKAGVSPGSVLLVHSAMRTIGPVDGGAATIVDALRSTLGEAGTLVAPTFTFYHELPDVPVIDPAADRSEMGAITERVRQTPGARRSTALRHSFAAVGPAAETLTDVDPALSAFDVKSSFGRLLDANAEVLLLGVCYTSSTSHHFAEWVCDVPYRRTMPKQTQVRLADGRVVDQPMLDYQPKPGEDGSYSQRSPDFNRLGRMLEERGKSQVATLGNAVIRRFALRDLIGLAREEAGRDYNVFRFEDGQQDVTQLTDGQLMMSHEWMDGAGRPNRTVWSVVDPARVYKA